MKRWLDLRWSTFAWCDFLWFPLRKKLGGAASLKFFFTFQTISSRFRQKKNQNFFSPRTGSTALPPWGKFFKFFFLNRLKMVWNVKKSKKIQGGGAAGAEFFFFKKFIQKHHYMQKFSLISPAISSGTPPHHETCIVVQPHNNTYSNTIFDFLLGYVYVPTILRLN